MQQIERGAQRQHATGAIHRHVAGYFEAVGIDKHRARLRRTKCGIAELYARGIARGGRRSNRINVLIFARIGACRGDLRRERLCIALRLRGERISVDQIFQLRRQHIERAAERRHEDERRDKQANVKM